MKERVLAVMAAIMFLIEMTKVLAGQLVEVAKVLAERYHELIKIVG